MLQCRRDRATAEVVILATCFFSWRVRITTRLVEPPRERVSPDFQIRTVDILFLVHEYAAVDVYGFANNVTGIIRYKEYDYLCNLLGSSVSS